MKERPILFGTPMVQAILEDRKTQTRRVIKPQPSISSNGGISWKSRCYGVNTDGTPYLNEFIKHHCPYGQVGDQLWVRETWGYFDPDCTGEDYESPACAKSSSYMLMNGNEVLLEYWKRRIAYKASFKNPSFGNGPDAPKKWHPSIHMPRWASRIQLEITHIRVERLQDISRADAIAEGCKNTVYLPSGHFAEEAFGVLWRAINGPDSWSANPWVWVIEFKLMERSN